MTETIPLNFTVESNNISLIQVKSTGSGGAHRYRGFGTVIDQSVAIGTPLNDEDHEVFAAGSMPKLMSNRLNCHLAFGRRGLQQHYVLH